MLHCSNKYFILCLFSLKRYKLFVYAVLIIRVCCIVYPDAITPGNLNALYILF